MHNDGIMNKMRMKNFLLVVLVMITVAAGAQSETDKLTAVVKEFHRSLTIGRTTTIDQHTDKALLYGHSNGWVETKAELIKNIQTGYMNYTRYDEDSLEVVMNDNMANVRFIANVSVAMNGTPGLFRLRVLEVWVKKSKRWILFGRQATRIM